jgi:hypothetical protein
MNTDHADDHRTEAITFRVEPSVRQRIELVARHCGVGRSELLRLAVAHLDSRLVVADVDRLEAAGPLPPKAEATRRHARRLLAEIKAKLEPQPLV